MGRVEGGTSRDFSPKAHSGGEEVESLLGIMGGQGQGEPREDVCKVYPVDNLVTLPPSRYACSQFTDSPGHPNDTHMWRDTRALTLHPQFAAMPPRHGMTKPRDLSTCTQYPHMMSPARPTCSYPMVGFTLTPLC